MPRFVAKPIIIEAHQWLGHTHELPEDFRMAVARHIMGGVEIMTQEGLRPCKHYDWIARGPEGQFFVIRSAAFEAGYEAHVPKTTLSLRKKETV